MKEYIVITGASSGIGQSLTIFLANKGYTIFAIGQNRLALQQTKMLARHGKIIPYAIDISHELSPDLISENIDADTQIKYLIHCAATAEPMSPLMKVTRQALQKTIDVNVMAPIFLMQKLSKHFNSETRVLFIGSDYAGVNKIRPNVSGAYGISKSALRSAVEYLRHECGNIALVGYLNPGPTQTLLYGKMWTEIKKQGTVSTVVQPAQPLAVTEFIVDVLENSAHQEFQKVDWDYRNENQREQVKQVITKSAAQLKSRL